MGYKKETDDKDTRFNVDWLEFPDEVDDHDPDESDSLEMWKNEDGRAEDLLIVSKLEMFIHRLRRIADEEIDRREKLNQKARPLWLRVLLHNPKNNKQTLFYLLGFGTLMVLAVVLFIFSMNLIF